MVAYRLETLNYMNCTPRALWVLAHQNNIPTEINLRFQFIKPALFPPPKKKKKIDGDTKEEVR